MTEGSDGDPEVGFVLVVCTGNQCRSPMAAAMLDRLLAQRGAPYTVESAGFVGEGAPCPPEVHDVMGAAGFDLSGHRSRVVRESMIAGAGLVLGMTRQHVIDLSLLVPGAWQRTFTMAELVRLGDRSGPRRADEPLASWLARVGSARRLSDAVNLPRSEDIPDPIGKRIRAYVSARDAIASLSSRLADLLAPV